MHIYLKSYVSLFLQTLPLLQAHLLLHLKWLFLQVHLLSLHLPLQAHLVGFWSEFKLCNLAAVLTQTSTFSKLISDRTRKFACSILNSFSFKNMVHSWVWSSFHFMGLYEKYGYKYTLKIQCIYIHPENSVFIYTH